MRKSLLYISLVAVLFMGCSDELDLNPVHGYSDDTVVYDQNSAENVVRGCYLDFLYYWNDSEPGYRAGYLDMYGWVPLDLNARLDEGDSYWQNTYKFINRCNSAIMTIGECSDSEFDDVSIKKGFIAEVTFLRALCHFELLRLFGHHWDLDSEYGIIQLDEPSSLEQIDLPRNTVAENYEMILADLDAAIINLPEFSDNKRASLELAKGIKAKVLLYRGQTQDYKDALELLNKLLPDHSSKKGLEENYLDVFAKGYENSEMLLCSGQSDPSFDVMYYLASKGYYGISSYWNSLFIGDEDDERYTNATIETIPYPSYPSYKKYLIMKNFIKNHHSCSRYLRWAEIYLMKAELVLRTGGDESLAFEIVNIIRDRAKAKAIEQPANTQGMYDLVYTEYVKELLAENGESYYASIRFKDDEGKEKIYGIVPGRTIASSDKFVYPIPYTEMLENGALEGHQNPSY